MRKQTLCLIDEILAGRASVSEYHDADPENEAVPHDAVARIVAEPDTDAAFWEELGFPVKRIDDGDEFWILELEKPVDADYVKSSNPEERQRFKIPDVSLGDTVSVDLHARSMRVKELPAGEIHGKVTEMSHYNGTTDIFLDTEQLGELKLSQLYFDEWAHDVFEPLGHSDYTNSVQWQQIAEWDRISLQSKNSAAH